MPNTDIILQALARRRETYAGENKAIAKLIADSGAIILPRRVGDTVYYLNGDKSKRITTHTIAGFAIDKHGVMVDLGDFIVDLNSERLFLYLSDAERAINYAAEMGTSTYL